MKPKILIVDDKVENLFALEQVLSDLDVEFIRALSGNEAITKTLEFDFAIVLIDVQMPDMDGFETVALMRQEQRTKQTPVIFVSAIFKEEYYQIKGIETGAVDFITKPIVAEILVGKVRYFLELSKYRYHLETLVEERTFELAKINEYLKEDIAKRKRTEEALQISEEHYKNLVSNVPGSIYISDVDWTLTFASPTFEDIIGYPVSDLINNKKRTFASIVHPDDIKYMEDEISKGYKKNQNNIILEYRIIHQKGDIRWISDRIRILEGEDGKEKGFEGLVIDVTERKKVEDAIKNSEERHRSLIEATTSIILTTDADGGFVTHQPSWEKFTGQSWSKHKGFGWGKKIHPDDIKRILKVWKKSLDGLSLYETWGRIWNVNLKEWRDFEMNMVPLIKPDGSLREWVGVITDVTEQKQAEEELSKNKEKYRTLINNLHTGVVVHAADTSIVFNNLSASAILGLSKDQMRGKTAIDPAWFFLHEDGSKMPLEKYPVNIVIRNKKPLKNYVVGVNKPQTDVPTWVLVNAFPEFENGGNLKQIIITFFDITERKKIEEEKLLLEAQLLQSQKLESIGTLAGGVAHEINNPINGIMNYAQLIGDRLEKDNPLREYADEIIHETKRMGSIVHNLLTFARQENEDHSPAKITDIIESTLSLIRTIIRRDQIKLEVNMPGDLPKLKCRSQQIQQVLMNLMTNARDALNERFSKYDDNKIITLTVGSLDKNGDQWIRITVEDLGIGISDEIRESMFDPFFTTKDRAKGTGLGLSISYGIVKDHHGELHVESELGQYTRFHLDLPVNNGWSGGGDKKKKKKKGDQ